MRRVFADAFFFIAVLNRADAAHRRAMEFVAGGAVKMVTTVAILLEVADAMSTPARRLACGGFIEDLPNQPNTVVRGLDDELLARGLRLYRSRPDKEWSLTDCISFVVMGEEELAEALTGDRHFEQAGFTALLV